MNVRNALAVGIGSLLVGVALIGHVGINDASAAYRRVHSAQCHYFYDDAGTGLYNGAYLSTSVSRGIYCPAPSDSTLPHSSTTTLNVHGYSPSAFSAYSQACAKEYNTSAYSCGTAKYWAAGYGGVYGVSVSAWANGASMPVVYNYLPAGSTLYGFFMAN
ncbi:MAG TPA: hypothetical protein VNO30_48880 [Kofleriaceae bacterium]|nr:hypothetical protein [Kofleriaceae bacterium]